MCRAFDQREESLHVLTNIQTSHQTFHVNEKSAYNHPEQNYILHINTTYILHDFNTIFFSQVQLLWELYFTTLGILPRFVPHFRKTLLMATCTCLLQFAFVVLTANMDQRKLEIPFILEPNIPKLLDVIASFKWPSKIPTSWYSHFCALPPTLNQTWSVWPIKYSRSYGMLRLTLEASCSLSLESLMLGETSCHVLRQSCGEAYMSKNWGLQLTAMGVSSIGSWASVKPLDVCSPRWQFNYKIMSENNSARLLPDSVPLEMLQSNK